MSIYNLRPYIGNFPLIGGYNLGPYIGGEGGAPVIPLPIQLGVNSWHNYTDASKIIEGATAVNIAGWTDETGNYDLAQATPANQPTFNVNKADFDGDDFLTTGSPTIGTTGLFAGAGEAWTVITLADYDVQGYSISKAQESESLRQFGVFLSGIDYISVIIRGESTYFMGYNYTLGDKVFIAVTWDGTTLLTYIENDPAVTVTIGTAVEDTATDILIGARTGGFNLDGTMYQDLIFDTCKTPAEIANLKTYLEAL